MIILMKLQVLAEFINCELNVILSVAKIEDPCHDLWISLRLYCPTLLLKHPWQKRYRRGTVDGQVHDSED